MLEHGGRLQQAVQRHGIPRRDWLDLSTGINPQGWLLEHGAEVPAEAWSRLPEDDDDLVAAARQSYGCTQVLPVAGSQAAIQALPRLRPSCRVGVLTPGYNEHGHAWRQGGHSVTALGADACEQAVGSLDVLVLGNPNNPDGRCFQPGLLLDWQARLARRGGWLVVDEAFVEASPEISVAAADRPGLVVLRSLGKFYGLAGARVGFALGDPKVLEALRELLGPWPVAGPSRVLAARALRDRAWQAAARERLLTAQVRLHRLLHQHGLEPSGGCALFQWVVLASAPAVHETLARQGILTRLCESPAGLRFGLPGTEAQWQRLDAALAALQAHRQVPGIVA